MKTTRLLLLLIFGTVFAGGLSQGEQPAKDSDPRKAGAERPKNLNDPGKRASSEHDSEEGAAPNKMARKGAVPPGKPRLKPATTVPLLAEQQKRHDEHAPAFGAPGNGMALPQQAKTAGHAARPALEIPKTNGRPRQTASAAGSSALNGTSMNALRHSGASQGSVGGMKASTARGAAAVNGTEIKPKP